jgi:hypothetical protein
MSQLDTQELSAADEPLLTTQEVAARLRVRPGTLCDWRVAGSGPAFIRCGRSIRYLPSAVREFLDRQTVAPAGGGEGGVSGG